MNSKAKNKSIIQRMAIIIGIFIAGGLVIFAIVVATLLLQIKNYKKYWANLANSNPDSSSLTYLALGDSTAQAIGATSPSKGYVGLIAKRIEQKTDKKVHIINISVTGAKVEDALKLQIPQIENLKIKPDIVTIEIGANNLKNFDEKKFEDDFSTLLKLLPPNTYVSDMPYFGSGRERGLEPVAIKASGIINRLLKNTDKRMVPLYETTKTKDSWNVHSIDLFHPSNSGYKNWADAFWSSIEPNL